MFHYQHLVLFAIIIIIGGTSLWGADPEPSNTRPPSSEAELRYWLENMAIHEFDVTETSAATGIEPARIGDALKRFELTDVSRVKTGASDRLLVLPYPGGRHPRIGFLEGAIRPQRETKCSVFAPWENGGYAVVDVPEAIWFLPQGERKLLYLAHTHVPTVWTEQSVDLEKMEWKRMDDGQLEIERLLPNKVAFGARVRTAADGIRIDLWIRNGSSETLSGLLVQNCVMLKALSGFNEQTNDNKVFESPFAACHDAAGNRWVITGWQRCERPWANVNCPCLHADPQFEDCPPGETRRLRGWLSFYEGDNLKGELQRLATSLAAQS
jgi:hypothetical protein